MVVGFFAIIMGCSDNAYLALRALFGCLPFVLFKSRRGMKRYLLMLATFGTVIQCIDFMNQAYAEVVIGLDSLFRLLVNFSGLMYVVFLVAAGWRMAVSRNRNGYIVGCLFAVLCYSAQALVNLNLPISTPIMWLLLSVGMAACRGEHIPDGE